MKKFLPIIFLILFTFTSKAQDFTEVSNWMRNNTEDMGGRAILVVYKGTKIIYTQSENNMTRRQKILSKAAARKMDDDTNTESYKLSSRAAIASCSKWLSAALVMTFVDEGKLKLTDTIGKYLPVMSKNGKGGITIADCLSHRTGIKTGDLKEELKEMKDFESMDDAIAHLAATPMEGKPGTVFRYSNAGLQIAGAVLEQISGKSFEDLFAERIAKPLDMKHTDFGHKAVPMPAGGAYSTPEDYINFLSMILKKGIFNGRRVLSEKSIAEMQVNRITPDVTSAYSPAETQGLGYGFGEWVFTGENAGIVSSPGLFGSFPWVDNKNNYCAFLMTFNINHEGRQERYAELTKLVGEAITKR